MRTEGTPRADRPSVDRGVRGQQDVRVWMLGGFRVTVGSDRTIEGGEWRLRKAASLLKLLALASGHRIHREQAIDLLWPDTGTRAASNNLRQVLYGARRVLDPASGSPERYLSLRDEQISLCSYGQLWVDVDAFEKAASTARRSRDPAAYRTAIDLYSGELLPEDRYEEWAEGRREQLRHLYLALLVELAGLYGEHGEFAPAIEALQGVLAEEPSNEEAHAGLMRTYALSGSRAKALAQFGWLERSIDSELGTEPSASSRALRDEISAGLFPPDESNLASFLPGKPAGGGKHNLPAQRTSFVGREREMVEVKRTLAMTRILTLTGSGGSGQTRLALEIARDLPGAYPDGVWLVELAPLSEGELVPSAVANAVRVQEQATRPLTETLVDALRGKDMLLLVDNCEHLVESIAYLLDVLLDGCPRLRVLATSREPLDVAGEVRWMVPTLSVPNPSRGSTVEELEGYESVRLFVARAHDRDPSFSLTPSNAQAVTEVCRRLEGIPLAIELVAARVGTLSVEQISERLEGSLELLTRGGRTVAPRQRTLKKTFDWSHDLLTEAERVLFRRLAVFGGGSTLEAAEAVCLGAGIEHDDVLDVLGGLVDKSLVVAEPSTAGAVRHMMLEPVRQYALKKLEESREGETVSRRHAEYFLKVAEEADLGLTGRDRLAWLERLRPEHPNVRSALSWALEREEAELALRLAGTADFSSFGEWSGLGEWRVWLEEALANGQQAPPTARAIALGGLMWVALWQGDFSRAEAAGEECLALSRQTDDPKGVAFALRLLASVAIADRGDYRRATELCEEGMALCREHGYKGDLAYFLSDIGENCMLQGDYGRAKELHDEAATLLREEMNGSGLELVLESQGWATLLQGEREQARALFEEGLALCRNVDNKLFAIGYLEGLACIAAARAKDERAAKLFGAARTLHETLGYRHSADQRALREPYLTVAQSRLDESVWEAAFAEGKAMTFEEAVEYALGAEEPDPSANRLPSVSPTNEPMSSLTRREREVVTLVVRGLTNRQIAQELSISERTAANHVAKILKKLGLSSRTQIRALAVEDRT